MINGRLQAVFGSSELQEQPVRCVGAPWARSSNFCLVVARAPAEMRPGPRKAAPLQPPGRLCVLQQPRQLHYKKPAFSGEADILSKHVADLSGGSDLRGLCGGVGSAREPVLGVAVAWTRHKIEFELRWLRCTTLSTLTRMCCVIDRMFLCC